ncbi:type II toxin-antitoxin system VapC family toxin [Paramicrobacterium agarici]|uniref:PIN domain nuclease of toxin-antitoxin system n=1 Tax=Paramicrobacterium agarici TaxID=630514 RepID=A0A2A9DS73_9MICO|nr:type II toxin-antitoxin system VapC family toxin [Microbacterium agarici]PFG29433.1 PIN domain nuclease of toxin-antitoxin system [Microbacterium agarici]TQO22441.1 PIN domain nuclease of toxin-antitoxin system [Microbacterium agarici]
MRLLLDTHIMLWWLANDARLSKGHRELIADGTNAVFVSSVSIAEISIKASLGKLDVPGPLQPAVTSSGFEILSFSAAEAEKLRDMPWHHHDPFDRMLIAQASAEGLALVTVDERIREYDVEWV